MESTFWFKDVEGLRGALLAGATYGKLHNHNGKSEDDEEHQIQEHECSSAVFAGDVGEAPYIADADGAASGDEDEPDA